MPRAIPAAYVLLHRQILTPPLCNQNVSNVKRYYFFEKKKIVVQWLGKIAASVASGRIIIYVLSGVWALLRY